MLPGPPPELEQQQVVHPAAEHEPARITVAREMTAQPGDSEHRFADRGLLRHRTLRNRVEDVELRTRQRVGGRSVRRVPTKMTQKQKSPRDWCKDSECVEQAVSTLKLTLLVLAAGLERLEVFLDDPPPAIAVDSERDVVLRGDSEVGQQEPFDSGLPGGGRRSNT